MPMDVLAATETARATHAARPAGPCAMVIVCARGDLTKRVVVPALYNLMAGRVLPEDVALNGVDIVALSTKQWPQHLARMMQSMLPGGSEFQAGAIDMNVWSSLLLRARRGQ